MMTWYYYLNYRVYRFYQRKKDSTPVFMAFLVSIMLVFMNIFSIAAVIGFFYPIYEKTNKYIVLVPMVLLGLINYFILYKDKYYETVFETFDKRSDEYKGWNRSITAYIIFSIVTVLVILAIADYRHDGHF